MAKTRRGLGRGLNSLLGGAEEIEGNTHTERPSVEQKKDFAETPQRQTTNRVQVTEERKVATPSAPAYPNVPVPSQPKPVEEKPRDVFQDTEIYTNGEDNVTIKGVVERTAVQENPKPQQKVAEKPIDEVPINSIEPNPDQPRTNFKPEELQELASSIKKDGLLQPILVRSLGDGKYQIIAGERRWQACKMVGMETVPVRIKEANDDKVIELALVENVQRSDLNPIEEAYGYRRMMERGNLTQSEVARAVSKGRSTIANALRLLELPEDAQQLLFEEKITAGHARAILSVPTEEARKKLTQKLVEGNMSVRETENLARLLSGKQNASSSPRAPMPQSFKKVARSLRSTLNTNVRVKSVKGKNKIEIEFKDEDDLQRLFHILSNEAE